jgi:hypothetical protein
MFCPDLYSRNIRIEFVSREYLHHTASTILLSKQGPVVQLYQQTTDHGTKIEHACARYHSNEKMLDDAKSSKRCIDGFAMPRGGDEEVMQGTGRDTFEFITAIDKARFDEVA